MKKINKRSMPKRKREERNSYILKKSKRIEVERMREEKLHIEEGRGERKSYARKRRRGEGAKHQRVG